MKKRRLRLALAMAVWVGGWTVAASGSPPNVILILADDMGWADSSTYGSSYYETPHLDRLAQEGMRFTDAYAASPLCSPTRASIMSGQHPARLHLTLAITAKGSVARPTALPPAPDERCGEVESLDHLPLEVFTLAEALQADGYRTAHIGKWHLSTPATGDARFDAQHQGFDFVIGGDHLPGPPDYYSPYEKGGHRIPNLAAGPDGEYLNERLAAEAIRWIGSIQDSGKPFYLNLWHYAVHTPIVANKELLPKYRAKTDPRRLQECPEMATMIESMDKSLGLLLDWLDRPENRVLKANTVVLFTSDNGGLIHQKVNGRQVTSNRPLRGGKANTYEGGIRVPWLVRWPGRVGAGSVCGVPVSTVDLYPTILEMAGSKPSADQRLDGRSIVPLLRGQALEPRPVFFDFPHHFGILCASSAAVRLGDHKLIRFHWAGDRAASHHYELYDLRRDPSEAINLAAYLPEKVRELDALIEGHLQATGALVPIRNPAFSGNPRELRSTAKNAPGRPLSLSLPETDVAPAVDSGSREFRLRDQDGNPLATAALVLEGGEWVRVENRPDGAVLVAWDRSRKTGPAKLLFGWSGGVSPWEINDWTFPPCELLIR